MDWSNDARVGDWWIDALQSFSAHIVGSLVPAGFERVARIFHPIEFETRRDLRWDAVAARNDRIAHADMQLHAIATPAGQQPDISVRHSYTARYGELPELETRVMAELLVDRSGGDLACNFGVWDGYGDLQPDNAARMKIPSRHHFVARGTLSELCQPSELLGWQSPNLWWPDDRAWCVVSEIDFCWTYVAGSAELITQLESDARLEALQVGYEADHTVLGDIINT